MGEVRVEQREGGGQLEPIRSHVLEARGLDLAGYKPALLQRVVARRCQRTGCGSAHAYAEQLRQDPEELDRLVELLRVRPLQRFENAGPELALLSARLSRLLPMAKDQALRVWVVGCATGEWAYALAMALAEAGWTEMRVFGTDPDPAAIAVARTGRYPPAVAGHLGPQRVERFFVADEPGLRVAPSLRRQLVFARHDLLGDPVLSRIDLLCCRGQLLHLDQAFQDRVLRLLHFALRPDGLLLLGSDEDAGERFEALDRQVALYRRRGDPIGPRAPDPPRHSEEADGSQWAQDDALQCALEELRATNEELATSNEELRGVNQELEQANSDLDTLLVEAAQAREESARLLDSAGIALLVLDGQLQIQSFNEQMTRLIPLQPTDTGRALAEIASRLSGVDLVQEAAAVFRTLVSRDRLAGGPGGRRYLARIRPHRSVGEVIEGVVIVLIEIPSGESES